MGSKQTAFACPQCPVSSQVFVRQAGNMVAARMRYEEGSYEGEVNEAKNPEGQGTFEYRGDDEAARLMYDGGWKDKAAEGYGVMKWQNGDRYEGDWVGGLREGKGKYLSKSTGGKYEGEYVADLKEGSGKYTFSNGIRTRAPGREDSDMDKGLTLGRRRMKSIP